MKKIISILLLCLLAQWAWAQSGEGYDPQNPGDPNVYYRLMVEASPKKGGSVSPSSIRQLSAGATTYCHATPKTGYRFKQWMVGDSVVSTASSFTYTMPEENVTLIAYFDWIGNEEYSPNNPGDPFIDGYQHKVTLYATPSAGGRFNSSSFYLSEGKTTNVYAYPSSGYRFVSWKHNGKIISTNNPMEITMGKEDLEYAAQFVYDPVNPENPGANSFNAATGELIIDDFEAGRLSSAIYTTMGEYDYSLIQSLVVVGKISPSDLGFSYRMSNCSLIDLGRTSGFSEIPSYCFEGMSPLTKVVLPSCINNIGHGAFDGCEYLSEINCYALNPPSLMSNSSIPSGILVRVPSDAIDLYLTNEEWKNFRILPLEEKICRLCINIPEDAVDGRYKNMTLEINNIANGQILKLLLSNRITYSVNNLLKSSKYNIYIKNERGYVLGSKLDIELGDDTTFVNFQSLQETQTIELLVQDEKENNLTNDVTITWFDENGNYLHQGPFLSGVIKGCTIAYSIDLSKELSSKYKTPNKTEFTLLDSNKINYILSAFDTALISGVIYDNSTRDVIGDAAITIVQKTNNIYNSQVIYSDSNGQYKAKVFAVPTSITIASQDYNPTSLEFNELSSTNALDIMLDKFNGAKIYTNFTYQKSCEKQEDVVIEYGYSEYRNIDYKIYNLTQKEEIDSFYVRNQEVFLLNHVEKGDSIRVIVSSRTKLFADVIVDGVLENGREMTITIPIIELGKLTFDYQYSDNLENCVLLYNIEGQLVRKQKFQDKQATMLDITDGEYDIVIMGYSKYFSSVLNLKELISTGLSEGISFVRKRLNIKSGNNYHVSINEIPFFDENSLKYTGNNTSFTVNKSSVTVGNYVTLRATIDFLECYKQKVNNVKFLVDLPEKCKFIDNSLLLGNSQVNYTIDSNRIIVELGKHLDNQLRFCAMPTVGNHYSPNAFVQFEIDGKTIFQPIGAAHFTCENLTLIIPDSITSQKEIVISGLAPSNKEISIFDNGILVGKTVSLANGHWETKLNTSNGKKYCHHIFYIEVESDNGYTLKSDSKTLVYQEDHIYLKDVKMINNGNEIVFDFEKKPSAKTSYSYNPEYNEFTFIANFSNNTDSMLNNVSIDVQTTDGDIVEIPAYYYPSINRWIGKSNLFSSTSLPQTVNVTYDYFNFSLLNDSVMFRDFIEDRLEKVILIDKNIISQNAETYKFRDNLKGDTIIYSCYRTKSTQLEYIQNQLINDGWQAELKCVDCTHWKHGGSSMVLYNEGDSIMLVGAFLLENNNPKEKVVTHHIIVEDDAIVVRHSESEMVNAWDRFLLERYRYPLALANCKIQCNYEQGDNELENLKESVRNLVNLQAVKLFMAVARTANLMNSSIGRPTNTIGGLAQAYGSVDAAMHMLDGMGTIMDCERTYLADILAYPDYCNCNLRELAPRRLSVTRGANGERKCRKGEKENKSKNGATPIIDPSGFVYEAVLSNRVPGVTATIYFKDIVEDMYGDLKEEIIKWEAEEYAQKNPLFTNENGVYAWDVPQGLWQVKFEKEGYETAYSEWLPVPPPQLDVNIGIVQNRQPEVKEAHAYEDGVELTFDKYMMPAYLTADNIKVSQNGKYVDGKVVLVDEEVAYRDENVKYVSTVRFVPNTAFSAGKEVTLVVANKVKSYAGIQMAENFTQSFDIEKEVKSIMADSLVKVPYQGSKVITLYVQPADAAVGKTMHAESSSEMLASLVQKDVVIDDNGMAQFEIKGELPGTTGITFSIDGVKTTATVIANVGDFEVSAINEPKASLVSGSSVYRGTTVKLTADSKDLKIWYTIDGTCPCDENGSRKQYTEPIVINSDMTLKAIAENADGDASDVATFIYSILQSKTGVALNNGWNWVSFNMKNDALCSVNTALASSSWTSDDVIKDNKYVDMYSTIQKQWIGTLSKHGALNNTQMYKVRSSKSQTLGLTGEAVHPSETTITVVSGWNYISYLPLVNMNVSDALKGYKAENGDVIKSQDAFATYSTANGWEGDLTTMTVGRGYMLKRGVNASQVSFTYPVESFGSSVKAAAPAKSYRYADNMNIIGEVEGINVEDGDSLVAYVNGEIRGASRLERNHKVFLTIQGDEDAKVAMVLVRDGEIIATASNMIGYQSNNVLGTSDAPTAITFVTDDSRLDGNVGNVKAIYGINGIKMNTRRLNNIPSGTYIIYSEKNGNTCVTKFIK